jgi:SAM-dependent methyltransferase
MDEFRSYLQKYLRIWPPHMAAVRAFESVQMKENLTVRPPSLDIGCGDGNFVATVFGKVDVGIDISTKEVRKASRTGAFSSLHCVDGRTIPYPDGYFKTIISNCVIEHIDQPERFIREIARVLAMGGAFVFTTWTPCYNTSLLLKRKWYIRWKSNILKHWSIKPVTEWKAILQKHGLQVTFVKNYLPPSSLKHLDLLELVSLVGLGKLNALNLYRLLAPFLPRVIILKIAHGLDAYLSTREKSGNGCAVIVKAIKDGRPTDNIQGRAG